MLKKPDSCRGCPFYGDGQGFVPDTINDQSEVFIVAQNPGADEVNGRRYLGTVNKQDQYEPAEPQPLIGKTGFMQDRTFLPLAGLSRNQVSLGNSLRCRVGKSNELPPLDHTATREALAHCHKAHFKMPAKTKLIVAQGEYALFAMTQHGLNKYDKISDWRGYVLPFEPINGPSSVSSGIYVPAVDGGIPVLATYHLAYLFRDPTASLVSKLDWRKIPRILNGTYPRTVPTIQDGPPQLWPAQSAFDTEFVPDSKKFLCYSLAYPSQRHDGSLILRVSEVLETGPALLDSVPLVVMQNAPADLPFLSRMLKTYKYDDIMHMHAVLWSDFPHDLGFMGSLYSQLNKWKHLSVLNPRLYSAADAYATWEIYEELTKEYERDKESYNVYKHIQLRLLPIIMAAEERGIKVNEEVAKIAHERRQVVMDRLTDRAQAVAGWPINLRSNDHVKHQLYDIEGLLEIL